MEVNNYFLYTYTSNVFHNIFMWMTSIVSQKTLCLMNLLREAINLRHNLRPNEHLSKTNTLQMIVDNIELKKHMSKDIQHFLVIINFKSKKFIFHVSHECRVRCTRLGHICWITGTPPRLICLSFTSMLLHMQKLPLRWILVLSFCTQRCNQFDIYIPCFFFHVIHPNLWKDCSNYHQMLLLHLSMEEKMLK